MIQARWLCAVSLIVLVLAVLAGGAPAQARLRAAPLPLDPRAAAWVRQAGPQEAATFLVTLRDGGAQTRVEQARATSDRRARREQVYRILSDQAGRNAAEVRVFLARQGFPEEARALRMFTSFNGFAITTTPAVVDLLRRWERVGAIDLNRLVTPDPPQRQEPGASPAEAQPNAAQWNISKIGADRVQSELGVTGQGVVVASLDTGVRYTHAKLRESYKCAGTSHTACWLDTVSDQTAPYDDVGHGTHTVGTAVGAGGIGVAPGARWIACKAFSPEGGWSDDIIACLDWLLAPGGSTANAPDVVINSWGNKDGSTTEFQSSIANLISAGIYPIFSNGNEGGSTPCGNVGAPASYTDVVGVGSTDQNDIIASDSSRGSSPFGVIKPDLVAPGVGISSAWKGSDTDEKEISGTSMAAPHVAGLAALLLAANPGLSPDQMTAIMKNTALPIRSLECSSADFPNNAYGWGRIRAYEAVRAAQSGSPTATPAASPTATLAPTRTPTPSPTASPRPSPTPVRSIRLICQTQAGTSNSYENKTGTSPTCQHRTVNTTNGSTTEAVAEYSNGIANCRVVVNGQPVAMTQADWCSVTYGNGAASVQTEVLNLPTPASTPTSAPTTTQAPSATPTPAPSATSTGTPTLRPTSTPTSTPAPTPTGPPTATATNLPTRTPTVTSSPTVAPNELIVSVPAGLRATAGSQVQIPLQLTGDASGRNIRSWSASLSFDPAVLRFAGARREDSLSAGWGVEVNDRAPGQLRLVAYGPAPLTGGGPLLQLAFDVTGAPGSRTDLILSAFRFNEGSPRALLRSGDLTVVAPAVGGLVRYARSSAPIADALLILRDSAGTEQSAASDANGSYRLSLTAREQANVTISKTGDLRNGLSALDAAWIAQYDAGLRSFTPEQLAACDVSGSGACSAYDAALLASFLIDAPLPESQAGVWRFTPASRDYTLADQDALYEHYTGYVVGDVTGNWGTSRPQRAIDTLARRFGLSEAVGAVTVQAPHISTPVQSQLSLPLLVGPVDEQGILGYELTIGYDPAVLDIGSVSRQGTLSADWSVFAHQAAPGHLKVVGYGIRSLRGSGSLLRLDVQIRGALGDTSPITIERIQINEGQPPAQVLPGQVTIAQGQTRLYLPLIRR